MRKYYGKYILASLFFLLVVTVLRGWLDFLYISMWIGAIIGVLIPDLDSFIYALYIRPEDLASQRIRKYLSERNFSSAFDMVYKTKSERSNLLFHSILFQLVFIIFSFYVLTSSGSNLGRGLVLGFLIHLAIDQYVEVGRGSNLSNWIHGIDINFSQKQAKYYTYFMFAVLVFLALAV